MPTNTVIILAGGDGNRFRTERPKQFCKIAGKTVLEHTIQRFESHPDIDSIVIVVNPNYYETVEQLLLLNKYKKVKKLVKGGRSRQESSYIGLLACENETENILIHDAVRMFTSDFIISNIISALESYQAVDVAIPAQDTIIEVTDQLLIKNIPDRNYLRRGQTPQGFKYHIIRQAHNLAIADGKYSATDDCGLVLRYNLAEVFVVPGEERNMKITYPEDIYLAEKLFQLNSSPLESVNAKAPRLDGKVIVIFGHSSGIGNSIYEMCKNEGCSVYGFSLSNGVDVSSYEQVEKAMQQVYNIHGVINHVVNTAGCLTISLLHNYESSQINQEINTNFIGAVNVTKASLPFLHDSKGSIVLFTSSSYTKGRALYSIYSSCKAAVVNFAQAVAEEVYPEGVRVNVINPERTKTPMRIKNFGNEPDDILLKPEQVAEATMKIMTSNITGTVVDVRLQKMI